MYLAICDDEPKELQNIIELWEKYDPNHKFDYTCFSSAAQLLTAASSQSFDVILLDIEMAGLTGFDAAKQLISREKSPLIIFVTKSPAYSVRGYGVAFRYLLKPVVWADFREAMDAALSEHEANRLMLNINDGQTAIHFQDILYIETFNHLTIVHTRKSSYTIRTPLSELTSKLPRNYFASPQKSYLVNMHYIEAVYLQTLTLIDGTSIPISRRKRAEFNVAINEFLGR